MKFRKKGIGMKNLASIFLVLFVVLVVIGPWMTFTKTAQAYGAAETCRLNVVAASLQIGIAPSVFDMELFRLDAPNPFYIDCPKRYTYLKEDSIKVDDVSSDLVSLEKDPDKSAERERQLKDFVLSEMTRCWRSFGDASDKVYTASPGPGEDSIDSSLDAKDTACFACSEVFIDGDFKTTTLDDFYEYANGKTRLTGESYVEFLTKGNAPEELPPFEARDDSITLAGGEQWSTVFTITKITVKFLDDRFNWVPFLPDVKKPPVNGGIIGCSVTDEDGNFEKINTVLEQAIGCENGIINGFVFGKVAKGFTKLDVDWLDTITSRLPDIDSDTVRFPMTVRFIPTEDVFKEGHCERLY